MERLHRQIDTHIEQIDKRKVIRGVQHFSHTPPKYHDDPTRFHCWCGRTFAYDHSQVMLDVFMEWLNLHASCPPPKEIT